MKEIKNIAISGLVVGVLAFLLTNFIGCNTTAEEKNTKETAAVEKVKNEKSEQHSCCAAEETEEYSDGSIYQLESDWKTQSGKDFNIGELKGKPVVLTMFFASCTYACPILVNDMKKIEASLNNKEDFRFVLVSIDPERDTPEVLMRLAKNNGLDLNRWTLLTGKSESIMELAALLGFKYRKEPDGQYSHSNIITMLNEEGEITYQHNGLNKDVAQAVTVLNKFN
jgi:protein SCO1/2